MKKKYLLLASVALLAGCGNKTSSPDIVTSATGEDSSVVSSEGELNTSSSTKTSSGTNTSSTKESSVSSSVVTDKLGTFFENLAEHRGKVHNKYGTKSSYFTMEFYGEDGYFFTGNHSKYKDLTGGVLNVPDNGVWKVVKDDNKNLVLDSLYQVANSTDFTTVETEYTGYYQAFDTFVGSEDCWVKNGNTFTIDEEDEANALLLDDLPGLARYLDGYSYGNQGSFTPDDTRKIIASNVSMSINSSATVAAITFEAKVYSGETLNGTWPGNLEITADGTYTTPAEMTAIQAAGIPDLTAWPTEVQNAFTALLGEQIPFVDGVSGAASFSMLDATTIQMLDPFCGNLLNDLNTAMTSQTMTDLGWAVSVAPTALGDGRTAAMYKRALKAGTDTTVEIANSVIAYFYDATYFDGSASAGLYPNGMFRIVFRNAKADPAENNVAQMSDYMSYVKKADGTSAIPALNFGTTTIESMTFTDMTADMSEYYTQQYQQTINFTCYYELVGKCATDADAKTAISTWLADLTTAGFTNLDSATDTLAATWESAGVINAGLADTAFTIFTNGMLVMVNLGQYNSTSKSYVTGSGYFEIIIGA